MWLLELTWCEFLAALHLDFEACRQQIFHFLHKLIL